MSDYKTYVCDMCGKEQNEPLYKNIIINEYTRGQYEDKDSEHYCCDFDICYECASKYKLGEYKWANENIEFIKENYSFLSKIRKLVKGFKEDRVKNNKI